MKTLGPIGIEAFERRNISAETAVRYAIYTASRQADGSVIPDSDGNIVVFPFLERGVIANEKYRAPGKKFWQRAGGRRTFWNADALDDPALDAGNQALVITEGEIDALTAIECGFPRRRSRKVKRSTISRRSTPVVSMRANSNFCGTTATG
jgi:twinkle protein